MILYTAGIYFLLVQPSTSLKLVRFTTKKSSKSNPKVMKPVGPWRHLFLRPIPNLISSCQVHSYKSLLSPSEEIQCSTQVGCTRERVCTFYITRVPTVTSFKVFS